MKYITFLSALLTLGLFTGCETTSESSASSAVAYDGPTTKLYVEYRESNPRIGAVRYNSINNEMDRYYYFKKNFEDAAAQAMPQYELEFGRFPMNAPEGLDVLEITFLSLNAPTRIELEMRMWAILKLAGQEHDFGISLVRHVPQMAATSGSVDRDLDAIYTKVSDDIIKQVIEVAN
jgi:hypothetical protein